jgi:tRNA uridine 5-carboxymethylaminomethyl modification enzyme
MRFDVIVVGAGHAGVEAAFAAARLGCHVGLCTLSRETVAHMPCNPAVGGTGRSTRWAD